MLIYFGKQLISYVDGIINNLIKRECKVLNKNVDLFSQAIDFIHGWHYKQPDQERVQSSKTKFRTKMLIYFGKQLTSYMDVIINNLIKRECKARKQSSEQKC